MLKVFRSDVFYFWNTPLRFVVISTFVIFLLTSCTYAPNYSKVDSSDHSTKNYHYSARQMAVGLPNQAKDSMVTTTYDDGENTTVELNAPQTPPPQPSFERATSNTQPSRKFDTSYIFPNPFVGIIGIFANAIKNFNDRMEYVATHPYNYNRGCYVYQPTQDAYITDYQQSLRRHGIYGPQNSLEAQSFYNTAQVLNANRY